MEQDTIASAVAKLGGIAPTARALGISSPAVHQWTTGARRIPADRCPALELATAGRVLVDAMRPDVAWVRVPDPDWPHPQGRPCLDVAAPPASDAGEAGGSQAAA